MAIVCETDTRDNLSRPLFILGGHLLWNVHTQMRDSRNGLLDSDVERNGRGRRDDEIRGTDILMFSLAVFHIHSMKIRR